MIQFDEHIFHMGWNHQLVFFLMAGDFFQLAKKTQTSQVPHLPLSSGLRSVSSQSADGRSGCDRQSLGTFLHWCTTTVANSLRAYLKICKVWDCFFTLLQIFGDL